MESHYLEELKTFNFDSRYYEFAMTLRDRKTLPKVSIADWEQVLKNLGLKFRYNAKEKFFDLEERAEGDCTIGLRLAMTTGMLEPILVLKGKKQNFSGPFQLLAYKVGVLRDANFSPKPPYPKLPYLNVEQLREVISFSLELFESVAGRLLSVCNVA